MTYRILQPRCFVMCFVVSPGPVSSMYSLSIVDVGVIFHLKEQINLSDSTIVLMQCVQSTLYIRKYVIFFSKPSVAKFTNTLFTQNKSGRRVTQ